MTRSLEQAVETLCALPDEVQDELAAMLLHMAGIEQARIALTAEEQADLDASLAEAERGECASDADVRGIWAKYGR